MVIEAMFCHVRSFCAITFLVNTFTFVAQSTCRSRGASYSYGTCYRCVPSCDSAVYGQPVIGRAQIVKFTFNLVEEVVIDVVSRFTTYT